MKNARKVFFQLEVIEVKRKEIVSAKRSNPRNASSESRRGGFAGTGGVAESSFMAGTDFMRGNIEKKSP